MVWTVTLLRVRMVTQANSRLLWFALLTLTLGQTLQIEGVYRAVEDLVGAPGSAAVLKHSFALFSAANTAAVVAHLLPPGAQPHTPRRTWLAFSAALAVSALPWLIDPPRTLPPSLQHRAEYYDNTWHSLVHWASFLGYLGWALWVASRLCWRFRRVEEHAPTRTAVTLVGLGTTIGGAYIVEKTITVLGWWWGHGPALIKFDQAAEAAVLALSVSLIAIGTAYEAGWDRLAARRRDRQLREQWRGMAAFLDQLQREFPDIETPAALTTAERLVAGVAMIHEGLRRLTAYAPPPSPHTHGVIDDDLALCRLAGWLHQALTAKKTGAPGAYPITGSPVADTGRTDHTARYLLSLYKQTETIERSLRTPTRATTATATEVTP